MKKLIYFILFFLALHACQDNFDAPPIETEFINYTTQTHNSIDAKRLCFGELISMALKEVEFRHLVKILSLNNESNFNNEILLLDLWDKDIPGNETFKDLLASALDRLSSSCFETIEQIEAALFDDPLLALKFPDLINPVSWDEEEIIPVVYVNTIQSVSNFPGSGMGSYVGFHSSGFIDRYSFGKTDYFPLILKWSDDYVMFDRNLILINGTPISAYHNFANSENISEIVFNKSININQHDYYIFHLNELIHELNVVGNNIKPPYQLNTCLEQCPLACIPEDQRKITAKNIVIHTHNALAKDYEFKELYRWRSPLVLEDNVTLLTLTRHDDMYGNGNWVKRLIGTFRLNSLYHIESSYTAINRKYNLDGKVIELPALTLTYSIGDKIGLPLDPLVIAEDIRMGDLLRFSSNRIKLDRLGYEIDLLSGESILASRFFQDNLTNYDLYCIKMNVTLGFNSLGIVIDY